MGRKRKHRPPEDEPRPDPADLYDYGSDSLVVADHTDGGFPLGVTVTEYRRSNHWQERDHPWAHAKRALAKAFAQASPEARVEIDWVKEVGEGQYRSAFGAAVEVLPDPEGLAGRWLALVPSHHAPDDVQDRVAQEVQLLRWLGGRDLPFRIPRVLGDGVVGGRRLLVREWLDGVPLEMKSGRQTGVRPGEVIGGLAAAVHALEPPAFVSGPSTVREHATTAIESLTELGGPVASEARAWALDHVPDAGPSVLLHGDLLGQNVLLDPPHPPALIDWEYTSRGDPAVDLAVVVRGRKSPFGLQNGLAKLVDAYLRAGGVQLTVEQVRVHELCLVARWAIAERAAGDPPSGIDHLRGLLGRCRGQRA